MEGWLSNQWKQIVFLRGWDDQFFETTEVEPPQQQVNQRRNAHQRSHKSKIHHYNTKHTGRKVKTGSRQMRRHENSKYLFWGRGRRVHRQWTHGGTVRVANCSTELRSTWEFQGGRDMGSECHTVMYFLLVHASASIIRTYSRVVHNTITANGLQCKLNKTHHQWMSLATVALKIGRGPKPLGQVGRYPWQPCKWEHGFLCKSLMRFANTLARFCEIRPCKISEGPL